MEMWRALPVLEGDSLPRRDAIKPVFISSILSNCWQLIWQKDDKLIIDYEGGEIEAMWGGTALGRDFLAHYRPAKKAQFLAFYQHLFSTPCGATFVRAIHRENGPHYILITNFVPLLSQDGNQRIIFGTSEMSGDFKNDTGRLDFDKAEMVSANYIDLGYGIPHQQASEPNTDSEKHQ